MDEALQAKIDQLSRVIHEFVDIPIQTEGEQDQNYRERFMAWASEVSRLAKLRS